MAIGNLTAIGKKEDAGSKLYFINVSVSDSFDTNVECNFYSTQEIKTYEDLVNFLQQKNFTYRVMPCFGRGNSGYISEGVRFSGGEIGVYYYDAFDTSHKSIVQSNKSKIHITCDEV